MFKMDTISADVIVYELLTQLNLTDFIHVNQLNHKYNTYCQNQFIWKNRYQCDYPTCDLFQQSYSHTVQ